MISRMRTAFKPTQDASFNVRIENQKKMAEYMKDRPFGEGIGLAGVEARKYGNRYITTFPVDSYYVKYGYKPALWDLYCILPYY